MSTAEAVVDVAQIGATVIAAFGLLLTASQVKVQNTLARLERVSNANDEWHRWRDDPHRAKPMWDERTIEIIKNGYAELGSESTHIRLRPASAPRSADLPWLLGVLLPAWSNGNESAAPMNETDYRRHQSVRASIAMHILSSLRHSPDAAVRANFAAIESAVRLYVDHLSELAEKYELKMLDRVAFLGRYHRNIVQAAFHLEPYILADNAIAGPTARNGMRILALGEAAREFHWNRAIQRGAIRANSSCEELGWVIGKADHATLDGLAWRRARITEVLLLKHRISRAFTQRGKRSRNQQVDRLRAALLASKAATTNN